MQIFNYKQAGHGLLQQAIFVGGGGRGSTGKRFIEERIKLSFQMQPPSGRRLAISNIFFTALNALFQLSSEIAVIFFCFTTLKYFTTIHQQQVQIVFLASRLESREMRDCSRKNDQS